MTPAQHMVSRLSRNRSSSARAASRSYKFWQRGYIRKAGNGIIRPDVGRTVKTSMLEAGGHQVYRDLILGHTAWKGWTGTASRRQRKPGARPRRDVPRGWMSGLKVLTQPLSHPPQLLNNNLKSSSNF
jgi:hypothetical protein